MLAELSSADSPETTINVNSFAGNSAILRHSCYNATFFILPLTFYLLVKFPEVVYKEPSTKRLFLTIPQ